MIASVHTTPTTINAIAFIFGSRGSQGAAGTWWTLMSRACILLLFGVLWACVHAHACVCMLCSSFLVLTEAWSHHPWWPQSRVSAVVAQCWSGGGKNTLLEVSIGLWIVLHAPQCKNPDLLLLHLLFRSLGYLASMGNFHWKKFKIPWRGMV